jgi:glycolate oxidase iron-sulfur subunit
LRRVAIEQVLPYPKRLRLAMWPARVLYQMGLGGMLPAWLRETVALACRPDSSWNGVTDESGAGAGAARKGAVGFISGCVMSVVFGPTNKASVGLLRRAGYEVNIPKEQGCCGALHLHAGRLDEARAFARRNIAAFEVAGLEAIIINAAGCGSTLKDYGHLLKDDPDWAGRAARFSGKVRDLTEFLAGVGGLRHQWADEPKRPGRVTFHDACHLAHAQRITSQPRELVRAVSGGELVPMPESDVCCGGAGSYFLTQPGMAVRLQDRKIDNILRSGAETVVTTNPGCLIQIRAGLRRRGELKVQVVHIADYLWDLGSDLKF